MVLIEGDYVFVNMDYDSELPVHSDLVHFLFVCGTYGGEVLGSVEHYPQYFGLYLDGFVSFCFHYLYS